MLPELQGVVYRRYLPVTLVMVLFFTGIAFSAPFRTYVHEIKSPGTVVKVLPQGYRSLHLRGQRYFFYKGIFHIQRAAEFIVVAAPVGAIVTTLPTGFTTLMIDEKVSYFYGGVYYRKVPAGYAVIETPGEIRPQAAAGLNVLVTTSALNVRSGPGRGYSVVGRQTKGDRLKVLGHAPQWYFVQRPIGGNGWVVQKYTAVLKKDFSQ